MTVERGTALSAANLVAAIHELHHLGYELANAFADVDLVLSPTTAWGPPDIGAVTTSSPASELFREIFRLSPFAAMFNVTGGPGISIPWGRDRDGLPIGMHLGAAPGCDETVLSMGEALERARSARASA